MKFKNLIPTSLLLGALSPTFCLTSCAHYEQEVEDLSAVNYINDRTFSLMAMGTDKTETQLANICWGTGWIIDDATPETTNDFTYWMATNWHVKLGAKQVQEECLDDFNYYYGKGQSLDWRFDYHQFSSFSWQDDSNFLFNPNNGIDFMVTKVTFGESTPDDIKAKLIELNEYGQKMGHITDIADTWTPESGFHDLRTYIGGYPVPGDDDAIWEYHCLDSEWLDAYDIGQAYHPINEESLVDVAPQYVIKDKYVRRDSWMTHGASGSMLVAKDGDQFKVIGIYWGGFVDKQGFYPSFSIFNSTYKNFISSYWN